jgi:hypothetical protein
MPKLVGDARNDLVLHLEEVGDGLVEAFGPEMRSDLRFDELDVDAHAGPNTLHAAFEDIAHIELAPNLLQVDRLARVEEVRESRISQKILIRSYTYEKRGSDSVQSMSISTFEPA